MDVSDLFQAIGERYGLLPVYILVVGWGALQSGSLKQLAGILAIMAGVFITMFQAFNLGESLDVFHLANRFGLTPNVANGIAAAVFVFGLGFVIYGAKRLVLHCFKRQAPANPTSEDAL